MTSSPRRVGIVGAGTMGCGIAQLCAQSGHTVRLFDAFPQALAAAPKRIEDSLGRATAKGRLMPQEAKRAMERLSVAADLAEFENCDIIIEAVSEDLAIKTALFRQLESAAPKAVLATNTSSLAVTLLADACQDPGRVIGTHFFNPPVAMRLVEMIRTSKTDETRFAEMKEFILSLNRTPVDVKDTPGFVVNRVMRPFYLGGMRLAAAAGGIAAIDKAAREIGGLRMGPLELMDLIGLDVNLAITKVIFTALGSPERFTPHPLQQGLVDRGESGRKTGKGFYLYEDGKKTGENPTAVSLLENAGNEPPAEVWKNLIGGVIAEARMEVEEGVATEEGIDTAIKLAMNFPKGPFEFEKDGSTP